MLLETFQLRKYKGEMAVAVVQRAVEGLRLVSSHRWFETEQGAVVSS